MATATRRSFLGKSAATVGLAAVTAAGAAQQPNNRVMLAVMGVRGRGKQLLQTLSHFPMWRSSISARSTTAWCPGPCRPWIPRTPAAAAGDGHSRRAARPGSGRHRGGGAGPLARPGHRLGLPGRQARLRREAGARTTSSRAGGWSRRPASTTASSRSARSGAARRTSRAPPSSSSPASSARCRSCATWIAGNRKTIGHRAGRRGPGGRRLRPVARAGAGAAVQPQPLPLQLALVLGLRHRRAGQQRHPRPRRGPLAARPRRPAARQSRRRQVLLRRRPADARHADRHVRLRRHCTVVWEHRIWAKTGFERRAVGRDRLRREGHAGLRREGLARRGRRSRRRTRPSDDRERPHLRNFLDCVKRRASGPTPTSRRATRARGCATWATSPSASAARCASTPRPRPSRTTPRPTSCWAGRTGRRSCCRSLAVDGDWWSVVGEDKT